jgi:anti-sigma28 factor (negative regulator of flagellin synthesis)
MNIDRIQINHADLGNAEGVQNKEGAGSAVLEHLSSTRDTVALSVRARDIDRLTILLQQSHEERISEIRQRLESGTYNVSGIDIARSMIERNLK